MRLRLMRTWSGARRHRTILVQTRRWSLFLWVHRFERAFRYADPGILCAGVAWVSFNFYSAKAFE